MSGHPYREPGERNRDEIAEAEWALSLDAPVVTVEDFERFFHWHAARVGLTIPSVIEHPEERQVSIHFHEELPQAWAADLLALIGRRRHVGLAVTFLYPSIG